LFFPFTFNVFGASGAPLIVALVSPSGLGVTFTT
jgi:hypothetical protein